MTDRPRDNAPGYCKPNGIFAKLKSTFSRWFRVKGRSAYREMLELDTYKERFTRIYQENFWRSAESGSGEGSEARYTERLREWLPRIIEKYGIKTFVDAPCGDFNWMRLVLPHTDVTYIGMDIVESVIASNNKKYEDEKTSFATADICEDTLPDCDILMVRDCLIHLSYRDIDRFLKNIAGLNYRYLLTTTHIVGDEFTNSDIPSGHVRLIDLFGKPFNFDRSKVLDRVDDFPKGYPIEREMILIRKADVPKGLELSET